MLDTIGWIVTINIGIICFTYLRRMAMKYSYLDDCLRWDQERQRVTEEETY